MTEFCLCAKESSGNLRCLLPAGHDGDYHSDNGNIWPVRKSGRLIKAERLLLGLAHSLGGVGLHNAEEGLDILEFFGVEYYAHLPSLEDHSHD